MTFEFNTPYGRGAIIFPSNYPHSEVTSLLYELWKLSKSIDDGTVKEGSPETGVPKTNLKEW